MQNNYYNQGSVPVHWLNILECTQKTAHMHIPIVFVHMVSGTTPNLHNRALSSRTHAQLVKVGNGRQHSILSRALDHRI